MKEWDPHELLHSLLITIFVNWGYVSYTKNLNKNKICEITWITIHDLIIQCLVIQRSFCLGTCPWLALTVQRPGSNKSYAISMGRISGANAATLHMDLALSYLYIMCSYSSGERPPSMHRTMLPYSIYMQVFLKKSLLFVAILHLAQNMVNFCTTNQRSDYGVL